MVAFRTIVKPEIAKKQINPQSKVMLLGSCFAENMGNKLLELKFQAQLNPFGILYNPQSIIQCLQFILSKKQFTNADLFDQNGVWNSFYHHSKFSSLNRNELLQSINQHLQSASSFLAHTNFLIITLGTAWVYQLKTTGQVVSNCHKVPASKFNRYRLSAEQIVDDLGNVIQEISQAPNLQIVLTVSPIRHLKDGAIENQLSKSTLVLAANKLTEQFSHVNYFPAYEIMMDDLRDYRFYNVDMVHPSDVAIQYIWDAFKSSLISEKTYSYINDIEKLRRAMQHRPFQIQSSSFQEFADSQLKFVEQLKLKYRHADFTFEENYFKSMLE